MTFEEFGRSFPCFRFALAAFPYVTLIVLCYIFFLYDVVVAHVLALRAITPFSPYLMQASFLKKEIYERRPKIQTTVEVQGFGGGWMEFRF